MVKRGPTAYLSTIPCRLIHADLKKEGIPASVSYSAGTYICNALLYRFLHSSYATGVPRMEGFLHVPNEPSEVTSKEEAFGMLNPSMSFPLMEKAIEVAVRDSLRALRAEHWIGSTEEVDGGRLP